MQTNSITPDFDWKPTANTLAYFKLDWNLNDSSQYQVSATAVWNITFTTEWDLTYWVFNSSYFYTSVLEWNVWDITLCAWVKANRDNWRMEAMALWYNQNALYHLWTWISWNNASSPWKWTISMSNGATDFFSSVSQDTERHLLIATKSAWWDFNLYLDWNLVRNATYWTSYISSNVFIVWWRYRWSAMDEAWVWWMSRALYENRIRNLEECQKYRNKTKKHFWK